MLSMPFGLADELFSALDYTAAIQTLSLYSYLIGRHWGASYNRDYPLLWPFKKVAAVPMKFFGRLLTRALIPLAPIEINAPRNPALAAQAPKKAGQNGRPEAKGLKGRRAGNGREKGDSRSRPPERGRLSSRSH